MPWTGKSCPKCKGSGEYIPNDLEPDVFGSPYKCSACAGTGEECVKDEHKLKLKVTKQ